MKKLCALKNKGGNIINYVYLLIAICFFISHTYSQDEFNSEEAKKIILSNQDKLKSLGRINRTRKIRVRGFGGPASERTEIEYNFVQKGNHKDSYGTATTMLFFSENDKFKVLSIKDDTATVYIKPIDEIVTHFLDSLRYQINIIDKSIIAFHAVCGEGYYAKYTKENDVFLPKIIYYYPLGEKPEDIPRIVSKISYDFSGKSAILTKYQNTEIPKNVDIFKIGKNKVTVFFYDPFLGLIKTVPGYLNKSPKEQSNIWREYLLNSAVYVFKVKRKKPKQTDWYIIRGNPEKTVTAKFYEVKILLDYKSQIPHPNSGSDKFKNAKTITLEKARGSLFEHLELFKDKDMSKLKGNGVQIFKGYFMRIIPYSEIKDAVIEIINKS